MNKSIVCRVGFMGIFGRGPVYEQINLGHVLDGDGNHAPAEFLGPHEKKEASFYTIRNFGSLFKFLLYH